MSQILSDFFFDVIVYNIGFVVFRIASGGRYPKEYMDGDSYNRIVIVGIIAFLAIVLPIFYFIF